MGIQRVEGLDSDTFLLRIQYLGDLELCSAIPRKGEDISGEREEEGRWIIVRRCLPIKGALVVSEATLRAFQASAYL
jgi:hypothetical protein